ncbi:cryptococcal mannosyltransferase 1-domain-containing protein [Irpex rosettiformis]|uniref:Cryptococcal mannosyltransferase 1-domain-containing protein n=1 Tax=Irpex rosettiformis TaxID=378272 RepID=A0ACB8UKN5_9APHY|nr:cryptococcal mannosyltransferase 1-domain-containing protein [Irpex rosettiformis]
MACAIDFNHFGAYDTWVLRDRIGKLTYGIWPFFSDIEDYNAMKSASPVPVFSCWNGAVAFQADSVLPVHLRSNRTLSTSPLRFPPPATHPLANTIMESPALSPPLRFRASPRGEGCYSSECFLLPYDMRRLMGMDRIYVNPRVRVAYLWHYYWWHKWVLRHPYVAWFVEKVYDGAWMHYTKLVVGEGGVYTWDGGDCHPWWYGGWW